MSIGNFVDLRIGWSTWTFRFRSPPDPYTLGKVLPIPLWHHHLNLFLRAKSSIKAARVGWPRCRLRLTVIWANRRLGAAGLCGSNHRLDCGVCDKVGYKLPPHAGYRRLSKYFIQDERHGPAAMDFINMIHAWRSMQQYTGMSNNHWEEAIFWSVFCVSALYSLRGCSLFSCNYFCHGSMGTRTRHRLLTFNFSIIKMNAAESCCWQETAPLGEMTRSVF